MYENYPSLPKSLWPTETCNTQPWYFSNPLGGTSPPALSLTTGRGHPLMENKLYSFVKAGFPLAALVLQAPELEEQAGEASVLYPVKINL